MENYSVQVPPYTVGPEAYRQIEKQCHIYGKKAVVVGGKKAMAAAKDKLLAAVKDTGIEILDFVWFGGECTFNNAKKLEQLEAVRQADMIFAVGGGKAIDTCKLVSIDFEKPYFSFPTIASNCAPTSAVSIQKLLPMHQKSIFGQELEILMPSIMKSVFLQEARS